MRQLRFYRRHSVELSKIFEYDRDLERKDISDCFNASNIVKFGNYFPNPIYKILGLCILVA